MKLRGLNEYDICNFRLASMFLIFPTCSFKCDIIYTGYTEEEISDKIKALSQLHNIIVKFGRFIPDSPHIFDTVLGVELASNN